MSEKSSTGGNRAIIIGGEAGDQNVFVTGDHNVVTSKPRQSISIPGDVAEVRAELAQLRELLETLASPHGKKIHNAMEEAEEELSNPEPNKDEVGKALDRALEYAGKADEFNTILDKLKPHVLSVSTWLGANWPHIAGILGG